MWPYLKEKAAEEGLPLSRVVAEVLHLVALDAIFALKESQLICFQGGTCLHLLYGGYRYSEDLDFAGEKISFELATQIVKKASSVIERGIIQVLGSGECQWRFPSASKASRNFSYWLLFQPAEVRQKFRLKMELARYPFYRPKVLPVKSDLDFLKRRPLVTGLSAEELLAEKVAAVLGRPYLKGRDIFDLWYLAEVIVAPLDSSLIRKKLIDYDVPWSKSYFKRRYNEITREDLSGEMSRFLPQRYRQQLASDDYEVIRSKALQIMEQVGLILSRERNMR